MAAASAKFSFKILFLITNIDLLIKSSYQIRLLANNKNLYQQSFKVKNSEASAGKAQHNIDPLWYLNKFGYLENQSKSSQLSNKKSGSLVMFSSLKSSSPSPEENIPGLANGTKEMSIEEAIKKFQAHAKLEVTGKLDKKTIDMMKMPRCGHPDVVNKQDASFKFSKWNGRKSQQQLRQRRRRYALQGSKWSKSKLRFKVGKYPKYSVMSKDLINSELKRALDLWSEAADVEFEFHNEPPATFGSILLFGQGSPTKKSEVADIDVRFETGYHGDSEPFDGSGLILEFGGSTHFDADEMWTSKSSFGVNLYQVAVHEFGHALGLEHSENFDAIMAPFFRGYSEDFRLHEDDLTAIEQLYGKSKKYSTQNKFDSNLSDNSDDQMKENNPFYNSDSSLYNYNYNSLDIEDVASSNNNNNNENAQTKLLTLTTPATTTSKILHTLITAYTLYHQPNFNFNFEPATNSYFNNNYGKNGLFTTNRAEFVQPSSNPLCKEGTFDAITLLSDGFTYIFKDAYVYKISSNFVMDPSYPKLISNVFRGWNGITFVSLPNNLDTVLYVPDSDVTYFFKNNLYWRSSKLYQLDPGYPRLVSENFKGLNFENGFNGKLDASFVWSGNRRVYFVEADRYWRYDFDLGSIEAGYPKSLSIWRGLPPKITSAFQWINGITYFFDNDRYYRFNDLAFKVEEAFPMYPRNNVEYWFGCSVFNRLGKLIQSTTDSGVNNITVAREYETIKLDGPLPTFNYSIIPTTTSKIVENKTSSSSSTPSFLENDMPSTRKLIFNQILTALSTNMKILNDERTIGYGNDNSSRIIKEQEELLSKSFTPRLSYFLILFLNLNLFIINFII